MRIKKLVAATAVAAAVVVGCGSEAVASGGIHLVGDGSYACVYWYYDLAAFGGDEAERMACGTSAYNGMFNVGTSISAGERDACSRRHGTFKPVIRGQEGWHLACDV